MKVPWCHVRTLLSICLLGKYLRCGCGSYSYHQLTIIMVSWWKWIEAPSEFVKLRMLERCLMLDIQNTPYAEKKGDEQTKTVYRHCWILANNHRLYCFFLFFLNVKFCLQVMEFFVINIIKIGPLVSDRVSVTVWFLLHARSVEATVRF